MLVRRITSITLLYCLYARNIITNELSCWQRIVLNPPAPKITRKHLTKIPIPVQVSLVALSMRMQITFHPFVQRCLRSSYPFHIGSDAAERHIEHSHALATPKAMHQRLELQMRRVRGGTAIYLDLALTSS